jgi:hydroxymethylpyrimidine pyrophosphatase-like HAD family hydrolase
MTDTSWLIALDLDGTALHDDGSISDAVLAQVRRVDAAGHHVMLATGRSFAATVPVLERLGIALRFLVCSNGAITLHRERSGYRRRWVESFEPNGRTALDPRAVAHRSLRRRRRPRPQRWNACASRSAFRASA